MKTFTTSIFVPATAKQAMNAMQLCEMGYKVRNKASVISDDLGLGALDDLAQDEKFTLVVNGEVEKHHIKMKVDSCAAGKPRVVLLEPELPEVRRFMEWRVDRTKIMSQHKGEKLQFKNFTVEDLRRLIRTAYANRERALVNYR